MNVLLISPPWIIEDDRNLWKNVGSCLPPLGLAYIASFLEREHVSVGMLDCTAEEIAVNKIEDRLVSIAEPDFIGITATTPIFPNGLAIAKIAKRLFPKTKVVFGGVHPSVLPNEVLRNPSVDLVVRDEGEVTLKELVSGKPLDEIDGLSWKKNGEIVHNKNRALIKDLDDIPPPAYHLLPMKRYHPALGSYKRLPAMSIFATRGCPGRCTFCYRTFYGKTRCRSANNVIEEIKILQGDYGIKEIAFYDDTFTLFRKTILEFCERIVRENIDITWSCFSRADYVSTDVLNAMKKAGCHLILFGVESADETILNNIKKRLSLDKVKKVVRICKDIGIETRASYMIGNPGETEETIKKTIDFAVELDTDEVQFNITTAYPGTELFEWAEANGFLTTTDWSLYHMSFSNLNLPTVRQDVLKRYYKIAHTRFYLRPKIVLRRLFKARTMTQMKQETHGFLAILRTFK
jgi:anaerobic magnesium-protoporphyrin IX monomethyl ester cyclase